MDREKRALAQTIVNNVAEIEKALDVLAESRVSTYVMLLIQDKAFLAPTENQAAFIEGALSALNQLDSLTAAVSEIKNTKDSSWQG